jgi:hypothetical protein
MIKSLVSAAVVSLIAVTAAHALPAAPSPKLSQATTSDLVQVAKKYHNKGHYKNRGKWYGKNWNRKYKYRGPRHARGYYHGGRYWGRRYYARPYNWQAWGCIGAGPVWYCP